MMLYMAYGVGCKKGGCEVGEVTTDEGGCGRALERVRGRGECI